MPPSASPSAAVAASCASNNFSCKTKSPVPSAAAPNSFATMRTVCSSPAQRASHRRLSNSTARSCPSQLQNVSAKRPFFAKFCCNGETVSLRQGPVLLPSLEDLHQRNRRVCELPGDIVPESSFRLNQSEALRVACVVHQHVRAVVQGPVHELEREQVGSNRPV